MTEFNQSTQTGNSDEEHLPDFLRHLPPDTGAAGATAVTAERPPAGTTPPSDGQEEPERKRGWLFPVVTIGLALLAIACLALALLAPTLFSSGDNTPERIAPTEVDTLVEAPSDDTRDEADRPNNNDVDTSKLQIAALADPAWVKRSAAQAGIPERAMFAYAGAAVYVQGEFPDCGLGWNTLAAIGHVESEHGTLGGSSIGADGIATPFIFGIPLDGGNIQEIPDTDQGRLDGDTVWDRAVGPMQFLPSTWQAYATDGNGDGVKDPHQIDDASVSAAAYLCSLGGDLTQPENWIAAIDAYNPSVEYNNRVAEAANQYASV